MRLLLLVLVLAATPALAGPPASGAPPRTPRSTPASRPASHPEPVEPPVQEMGLVGVAEAEGVDGAGAVGMLTALAASFVFARGRRTR